MSIKNKETIQKKKKKQPSSYILRSTNFKSACVVFPVLWRDKRTYRLSGQVIKWPIWAFETWDLDKDRLGIAT